MNKVLIMLIALVMSILISCASQPKLVKAYVEPEQASPGDLIKMYAQFTGSAKDLKAVYLTVREYPSEYPRIDLYPGTGDDQNLWSEDGEIPWEASPGMYHLDVNAIKKDGEEIVSEGFENNWAGKAGTIVLQIK